MPCKSVSGCNKQRKTSFPQIQQKMWKTGFVFRKRALPESFWHPDCAVRQLHRRFHMQWGLRCCFVADRLPQPPESVPYPGVCIEWHRADRVSVPQPVRPPAGCRAAGLLFCHASFCHNLSRLCLPGLQTESYTISLCCCCGSCACLRHRCCSSRHNRRTVW